MLQKESRGLSRLSVAYGEVVDYVDNSEALSIHKIRQNTKMPTFYKTLYLVKREVIHKQKNRCATCKRKLVPYVANFHHVNGDRSDNRLSNCKALCIPCHRRKHVE